jgi:hypothetical protein
MRVAPAAPATAPAALPARIAAPFRLPRRAAPRTLSPKLAAHVMTILAQMEATGQRYLVGVRWTNFGPSRRRRAARASSWVQSQLRRGYGVIATDGFPHGHVLLFATNSLEVAMRLTAIHHDIFALYPPPGGWRL